MEVDVMAFKLRAMEDLRRIFSTCQFVSTPTALSSSSSKCFLILTVVAESANKGWFIECLRPATPSDQWFLFSQWSPTHTGTGSDPRRVSLWCKRHRAKNGRKRLNKKTERKWLTESYREKPRTHNLFISVFGWLVINICVLLAMFSHGRFTCIDCRLRRRWLIECTAFRNQQRKEVKKLFAVLRRPSASAIHTRTFETRSA